MKKGFSMVEALVSILIIGAALTATIPLMTKTMQNKTGVDKRAMECLNGNAAEIVINGTTGDTTIPSEDTACYAALTSTQYKTGNAFNTVHWRAEHGKTTTEENAAKTILRAACDLGGEKACDYFVTKCITDGSLTPTYCDETGFYDIAYYLEQNASTTANVGALYIADKVEGYLEQMRPSLLLQVKASCAAEPESLACDLDKPELYIKACNYGYADACEEAFDNNWNKSCSQVKTIWPAAPSDSYQLTYKGHATPTATTCNMYSMPSATITGCNEMASADFATYNCTAAPDVADECSDDCLNGYDDEYNQTCNQVLQNWFGSEYGQYNLTSDGSPLVADPVDTLCEGADPNCTDTVGQTCIDGTIFAGNYDGHDIFTTAADMPGGFPSAGLYTFDDGSNVTRTTYYGFTFATDLYNGEKNTYIFNELTEGDHTFYNDPAVPYRAAQACGDLITLGYDDWYLPSQAELNLLYTGKDAIGDFGSINNRYWSSTDRNYLNNIWYQDFSNGAQSYIRAADAYSVRCVRNNDTFVPPDLLGDKVQVDCSGSVAIGSWCDDGTVYIGEMGGTKYYVPATSTGAISPEGKTAFTSSVTNNVGYLGYSLLPSSDSGEYNTEILTSYWGTNQAIYLAIINRAPYSAAEKCTSLNDSSYLGHDDWYLPSMDELSLISDNYMTLGVQNWDTTYWPSNGIGITSTSLATYIIYAGSSSAKTLSEANNVQCMRNDNVGYTSPVYPTALPIVDCDTDDDIPLGSECTDGSFFIKEPSSKYFIEPSKGTNLTWNNGSTDYTMQDAADNYNGLNNTLIILASQSSDSPHYAAKKCYDYNEASYLGYNNWYLPAASEVYYLYTVRYILEFYTEEYTPFLTSTESGDERYAVRYLNNATATGYKNVTGLTICFRQRSDTETCEETAGNTCGNGSIYAGKLGGKKLFTVAADNSTGIKWGDTSTSTNAEAEMQGQVNTRILFNQSPNTDFEAALLCENLDTLGKTDWYLPSKNELVILYGNRVAIGGFTTAADTYYWSSTQASQTNATAWRFDTNVEADATKTNLYRVRCIRSNS